MPIAVLSRIKILNKKTLLHNEQGSKPKVGKRMHQPRFLQTFTMYGSLKGLYRNNLLSMLIVRLLKTVILPFFKQCSCVISRSFDNVLKIVTPRSRKQFKSMYKTKKKSKMFRYFMLRK